jgi:hypothetical protein
MDQSTASLFDVTNTNISVDGNIDEPTLSTPDISFSLTIGGTFRL